MSFSISAPSTRTSTSLSNSTRSPYAASQNPLSFRTGRNPRSEPALSEVEGNLLPASASTNFTHRLEQRRWPPLPGFAFLLGNILHVVHISARLREHMMQIVPHADEREALVQKFSDPRRPK